MDRERFRLLLIGVTIFSAALCLIFGVPRARTALTPGLQRAWVVSRTLGETAARVTPRQELTGTPVTLYAVVEATPFLGEPQLFGTVDSVVLEPGGEPVSVQAWKSWWRQPEFIWFKVEPAVPFANESFDPAFSVEDIPYARNSQVSWGFEWNHAADVQATGDAFPDWDTGTMRYAVRAVVRDGDDRILQQVDSPGPEAVIEPDPSQAPHRVTLLGGEDVFGHMLGFAGLPYVPTVGDRLPDRHPASRFVGGTILDFWLVSRRMALDTEQPLFGWQRLPEMATVIVEEMFLARDGAYYYSDDPLETVDWQTVRSGDLIVIEDHVGVLYEDRGPGGGGDGVLNRWDRTLEAYFEPLRDTALGEAFVSGITVYRLPAGGEEP